MNRCLERLYNGIIKENPTFVLVLGMCPTLAVTTSAINGIGMGLSTTAVLVMSNMLISMLRKIIPDSVRMPAFIVVVASFVTVVDFLLQGFVPDLYDSLGLYIPLIVVNCIILGRAESYASKNPVIPSIFDGLGMGLGFTVSLTCIGLVREILGSGAAFGVKIMPSSYEPITIFVMAPGAFFVLAFLTALQNKVKTKKHGKISECGADCSCCGNKSCAGHFFNMTEDPSVSVEAAAKAADKAKEAKATAAKEAKGAEAVKAAEAKPTETKPAEAKPETKTEENKEQEAEKK